ncbi:MAG: hypothetical protein R6V30_00340 [Paracoccaceae bacterium]
MIPSSSAQSRSFNDTYFEPIQLDCSVAQVLRTRRPKGIRQAFIENPYLTQVTLRDILSSPFATANFMRRCAELPHCGEATLNALMLLIENAANSQVAQNANHTATYSVVAP